MNEKVERTPYEKPVLERFGSFRELTEAGLTGAGDGVWICGPCEVEGGGGGRY